MADAKKMYVLNKTIRVKGGGGSLNIALSSLDDQGAVAPFPSMIPAGATKTDALEGL